MRKTLAMLVAVLGVAAIATPASAEARACGSHGTTADGATIEADANGAVPCSFAKATASRFYAVGGVPSHLWVRGIRMTYLSSRSGSGGGFWLYIGRRHGRDAAVTSVTQSNPAPSPPPVSQPPVSAPPSSPPPSCDPNYA